MLRVFGIALVLLAGLMSGCCCGLGSEKPVEPAARSLPATVERAEPLTAERVFAATTPEQDAEVAKMIAVGLEQQVLRSIDYEASTTVVGSTFYEIEFKDKEFITQMVATSIVRKTKRPFFVLRLLDSKTNKQVGSFNSNAWRLELE